MLINNASLAAVLMAGITSWQIIIPYQGIIWHDISQYSDKLDVIMIYALRNISFSQLR